MMKRFSAALLTAALLLTGGCWLPAGDPPPGNIVNNPENCGTGRTFPEAQEYFTAVFSLNTAVLCPGAVLELAADRATAAAAAQILQESGDTSGVRRAAPGEKSGGILRSQLREGVWSLELYREGKLLWRDEVRLK